ncbi:MAG: nitrate/nitrite transporter NarK [Chlamydiales bacterium]|jgi:nitrate/nitrite transporter NarK
MSFPCNYFNNINNNTNTQNSSGNLQNTSGNLQARSVSIYNDTVKNLSPNSPRKVSELLIRQLEIICENNCSKEQFPIELKERFHPLKECHFKDLEKLISKLSQGINQSDFNFHEALSSFFQEIENIDLNQIAKNFDTSTKLHSLFQELHEVKNVRNSFLQEDLSLPPLLSQLYEELKAWNSLNSSESFFSNLPPSFCSLFDELDELIFNKWSLTKAKTLKKKDIPFRFRKYTDKILNVKASPTKDRNAAALAFATGFAPAGIMAAALNKAELLSTPLKFALAAAPIIVGSTAQFWVGNQADNYGGRKTILQLLVTSAIGIASLAILTSQIDLASIDDLSLEVFGLGLSGIVAGAGLSVVPATFSIATRSGKANEAGIRQGFAGGIGTLSPGISNIIQAVAIDQIGLSNAYFIWLGISLFGTSLTHKYLNNSIYHQLVNKGIPPEKSKEISLWLGQELFPGTEICSVMEKLKTLSISEKNSVAVLAFNNVVSLGGLLSLIATLPFYFTERGSSQFDSLTYTGIFSIVNSLARTITGKTPLARRGELATKIGLATLGLGSVGLTFSRELSSSLPFLGVTAIGMGVANYGLFSWLAEEASNNFGIASGVVNGVGAMGGPILALALGALDLLNETEDTGYQFLLLPALAATALLCDKFLMPKNTREEAQNNGALTIEEVDDIEAQRRSIELQRI